MPKKKTGQRKKAEKMRERQKEIASKRDHQSIVMKPCNSIMVGVYTYNGTKDIHNNIHLGV